MITLRCKQLIKYQYFSNGLLVCDVLPIYATSIKFCSPLNNIGVSQNMCICILLFTTFLSAEFFLTAHYVPYCHPCHFLLKYNGYTYCYFGQISSDPMALIFTDILDNK